MGASRCAAGRRLLRLGGLRRRFRFVPGFGCVPQMYAFIFRIAHIALRKTMPWRFSVARTGAFAAGGRICTSGCELQSAAWGGGELPTARGAVDTAPMLSDGLQPAKRCRRRLCDPHLHSFDVK